MGTYTCQCNAGYKQTNDSKLYCVGKLNLVFNFVPSNFEFQFTLVHFHRIADSFFFKLKVEVFFKVRVFIIMYLYLNLNYTFGLFMKYLTLLVTTTTTTKPFINSTNLQSNDT